MDNLADEYIYLFSDLERSGTHDWPIETLNKAPYKPLLLLCVLDRVEKGTLNENLIKLDTSLFEQFEEYWKNVVGNDIDYNLAMPFYYMKSEGFWHLIRNDGTRDNELALSSITVTSLNKNLLGAALDEELFELIQKPSVRARLRRVLIETYFSAPAQELVYDQGRINKEAYHYGRELIESVTEGAPTSTREIEGQVRKKGFRQAVAVYAYQHQCAFCDIKIRTPKNHSAIEAAHIVPWSVSQNDDPRNGLGLCRLCHWIFDKGLITVSIDYKLIFSYALRTSDNVLKHIDQLEHTYITLPCDEVLNPDIEKLEWHYKKKFTKD